MSKKVKFKISRSGVMDLFKSSEMQAMLQEKANEVKENAEALSGGCQFNAKTKVLDRTAVALVGAADYAARRADLKDNILEKAVGMSGK